PRVREPKEPIINAAMLTPPPPEHAPPAVLETGPNTAELPELEPIPDELELPVILKAGDNISTDEILPAGTRVMPLRSNIPAISRFAFDMIDPTYPKRAQTMRDGGHVVVGGKNYGQGSSREHAALAPRFLGLRVVLAKSFARIHWQNLINFGVLPLVFDDPAEYDRINQGDMLRFSGIREGVKTGHRLDVENVTQG